LCPGQLFESEANRKIKKEPALAVEMGKIVDLFPIGVDADADEVTLSGDVISELWTFG
jgi:U3 small nucleolar RNA-associated protein 19